MFKEWVKAEIALKVISSDSNQFYQFCISDKDLKMNTEFVPSLKESFL